MHTFGKAPWLFVAMQMLFAAGCGSGEPPVSSSIHEAAMAGDLEDCKRHIKSAKPSGGHGGPGHGDVSSIASRNATGETALHVAALAGHLEVVKYLMSKGSDAATTDRSGATALHKAACGGHVPVAEYLMLKRADINLKDHSGETPLHMAAMLGKLEMAKYLVANGADVTAMDTRGYTPAYVAEMMKRDDVKAFLDSVSKP